jgi:hypothetical protein
MNLVEINGGNKFQREVVLKTINFMIDELLPRFRTLDITVNLKKMNDDAVGYCMMGDNNREFEIECSKELTLKDLVTTICHEMVHVKQYARKEMNDNLVEGGCAVWRGKKVSPNTTYYNLPWEKEAYKLQDKYAQKIWDADIL